MIFFKLIKSPKTIYRN